MSELTLNDVHKTYGDVAAVCGASFHVPAGQLAVLVGPSGCGKTTTLRLIAGLESPDRGEIRLDERDLGSLPPHQRGVTMVFQSPALYPHMNVGQNLAFSLRRTRTDGKGIDRRVGHAVHMLGLEDLLHRRPDELSGGEQQRVALGKAVVRDARLWLLDEPLASLDAPLRRQLGRDIGALQTATGTTALLVTHDQSDALAYADWLIVMNRGAVQQAGTPAEVYARPANRFVASFLGDPPMNLLSGQVTGARFHAEDISLEVPAKLADGPVEFGIRPEDVIVAQRDAPAALRGVVQRVEFRGHDAVFEVRIGNQTLLLRKRPDARTTVGASMCLTLPRENLHFFEANHEGGRADSLP